MGKATVVSGGDGGSYQIKIDFGKATQAAAVAKITARLVEVVGLLAQALGDLNLQEAIEAAYIAAVEAAIDAYVAATKADTVEAAAIEAALKTHTGAMQKLAESVPETAKLRLAWQILKNEQTQLLKDKAYWLGLVLEETRQAWCTDLTEDATGAVATIEIPGESALVLLAPAAPAPVAADGVLMAREVQSPGQAFVNAAVLPGWQKFKPAYRRGVITALDEVADTADVTLTEDKSSAQGLKINQAPTLQAVPVAYMSCNAGAFEVGDGCVVKFIAQDWAQPRVVGFVDNPKPCGGALSGVVRDGALVTVPGVGQALSGYKPTPQAWQYQLKSDPGKNPSIYHDEPKLAANGAQMATLAPGQFSGRMAQAVAVIMGRDLPVLYDYRWERCHGVVMGQDGKAWLVEVGRDNGVLAMLLPINKATANSPQDVIRESFARFGGLPSGVAFPVGAALTAARAAGTVIELAAPSVLADFYAKTAYSSACGWSFSDSGSQAHNTCYATDGAGEVTGHHYRLDLQIGALSVPAVPGTPVASGSASLAMVESGPLWWWGEGGVARDVPFAFFEPTTGRMAPMPGKVVATSEPGHLASTTLTTPILACHVNGALDIVRIRSDAAGTSSGVGSGPPYNISPTYAMGAKRYVSTGNLTERRHAYTATQRTLLPSVSRASGFSHTTTGDMRPSGTPSSSVTVVNTFEYVGVTDKTQNVGLSSAVWTDGMRDGYAQFREGASYQDSETYVYFYHCTITNHGYDYTLNQNTIETYDAIYYHANAQVTTGLIPELTALLAGKFDLAGYSNISGPLFNAHANLTFRPFEFGTDGQWGMKRYVDDAYYQNKVLVVAPNGPAQEYTYPGLTNVAIVEKGQYWRNFPIWPSNPFRVSCSVFGTSAQLGLQTTEGITIDNPGTLLADEVMPSSSRFTFIGYV